MECGCYSISVSDWSAPFQWEQPRSGDATAFLVMFKLETNASLRHCNHTHVICLEPTSAVYLELKV